MRNEIRWGVVGCGQIAVDKTVPALLAAHGARFVAAAEPLTERRDKVDALCQAASRAPVRWYNDYTELFADTDIDAVYIALPTAFHHKAVLAALAARKATLCEKPLGNTVAEMLSMVRASHASGVALMTGYMSRFGTVYREAARLLQSGAIGEIVCVHADFSYPALGVYPPGSPGGWRWTDANGGGAVLDIGIYLAFALREWLGDRIETVCATETDRVAPPGLPVRDTNIAWFRTASGIPGTFVASFTHAECRVVLHGTQGRMEVENCFSQSPTGRLVCQSGATRIVVENDASRPQRHFEHYLREIEHFSNALIHGIPYQPTPTDVLADAQFLQGLRDSATVGAPIHLPDATDLLKGNE